MRSQISGFPAAHSMTSNDPAGDEKRRTSILCTGGDAAGVVWASRMVESRQRSNTCFTRSEGLVITKLPPMSFSWV